MRYIIIMSLLYCQHARVELPPPASASCKKNDCTASLQTDSGKSLSFQHKYYFGGLIPRKYEIKESEVCPGTGIRQIHQYYTFKDAALEQLTAFIYSPRTVKIICY